MPKVLEANGVMYLLRIRGSRDMTDAEVAELINSESIEALITPVEVCKWLSIKKGHLYYLVEKKKIPAIKIGGLLRFDPTELREWVKNRLEGAGTNG